MAQTIHALLAAAGLWGLASSLHAAACHAVCAFVKACSQIQACIRDSRQIKHEGKTGCHSKKVCLRALRVYLPAWTFFVWPPRCLKGQPDPAVQSLCQLRQQMPIWSCCSDCDSQAACLLQLQQAQILYKAGPTLNGHTHQHRHSLPAPIASHASTACSALSVDHLACCVSAQACCGSLHTSRSLVARQTHGEGYGATISNIPRTHLGCTASNTSAGRLQVLPGTLCQAKESSR